MREERIKSLLKLLLMLMLVQSGALMAQPFFDIAGISGWNTVPDSKAPSATETYANAFLALPLELGKGNKIIFSPFYESRTISTEIPDLLITMHSFAVPLTWLHYFGDSTWSFTSTFIGRINSTSVGIDDDMMQFGGAIIGRYRVNPTLQLKLGLYYNKEFFSDFYIPLAGIDWKINEKFNLFGLLPNYMKLEYRFNPSISSGVAFKSITNSYRYDGTLSYFKMQDNHGSIYADFYLPGKIVLSADVGHTIMRKFKNRSEYEFPSFSQDGWLFKAGIFYRIRQE